MVTLFGVYLVNKAYKMPAPGMPETEGVWRFSKLFVVSGSFPIATALITPNYINMVSCPMHALQSFHKLSPAFKGICRERYCARRY
jgi:hypothetical protein